MASSRSRVSAPAPLGAARVVARGHPDGPAPTPQRTADLCGAQCVAVTAPAGRAGCFAAPDEDLGEVGTHVASSGVTARRAPGRNPVDDAVLREGRDGALHSIRRCPRRAPVRHGPPGRAGARAAPRGHHARLPGHPDSPGGADRSRRAHPEAARRRDRQPPAAAVQGRLGPRRNDDVLPARRVPAGGVPAHATWPCLSRGRRSRSTAGAAATRRRRAKGRGRRRRWREGSSTCQPTSTTA